MTDPHSAAGASPVHALIQQREQLRAWIAKLDEVSSGAATRVAERIRQDYGDRLARVTAELGGHRDEIGRDLEALRAELREAEDRHTQASEAMEEMHLRHLIGELGADEWETQRTRLESEVASADETTRRVRGEVERLAALAADIAGEDTDTAFSSASEEPSDEVEDAPVTPTIDPVEPLAFLEEADEDDDPDTTAWLNEISLDKPAGPPDPPAAAATEEASSASWDPFGNEFGGEPETPQSDVGADLPWLETPTRDADAWTPASAESDGLEFLNDLGTSTPETPSTGGLAEDDLAFLEELDRAISSSPSRPATPPTGGGESAPKTTNGGPLLCKECGAINEPHSWYCEICGSEL